MIDLNVNIQEAVHELTCKPLFATSAERVLIMDEIKSKYNHLPQTLRFGHFFSELLSRISVPLEPHDLIAGRCVDRELTEEEEALYQAFIKHPDYPKKHILFDGGHCTYSWDSVIRLGLPGLKRRAQQQQAKYSDDPDKVAFFDAMIMVYDTIRDYMLRYAQEADRIGSADLAAALRRGATQEDNDFYSGLQFLWIIQFIMCTYLTPNPTLTIGRIDQLLYPTYQKGIQDGTLTQEFAEALITDFYCKHNLNMGRGEHQNGNETNSTTFERIYNFDAPQYMQLGGLNAKMESIVNELTYLFVKCIRPEFKNPVVVFQYTKNLNIEHPELWKMVVDKGLRSAAMMIYNDNSVVDCMVRLGIPLEDAVQHAHFGCNWPSLGPNGSSSGPDPYQLRDIASPEEFENLNQLITEAYRGFSRINALKESMTKVSQLEGVDSIEPLYKTYQEEHELRGNLWRNVVVAKQEIYNHNASKFIKYGDCFLDCAAETGESSAVSSKYHTLIQSFVFFATIVDCFATIDQLVYKDRKLTLPQLMEAVEANFEGYPEILALCRNVPKFGSDDPLTNQWASRIIEDHFQRTAKMSVSHSRGTFIGLPCIQTDTNHLKEGRKYGATPDGRLAGAAFSQNSRPSNGSCTNGLTGMFNSLLHITPGSHCSGAMNLDVDPKQFPGETGEALFGALLANFFNQGGLHSQISSTCVEDLLEAQIHPEEHRDLRVRITGYSGVFVDICKELQNDIIERFR